MRGESVFVRPGDSDGARWEHADSSTPTPAFAAEVADQVKYLLDRLNDDSLTAVATMKMAGATNEEVAKKLECSVRSVKRKLQVIRAIWNDQQL